MNPPFRIEETALTLLNGSLDLNPAVFATIVLDLHRCLRDGTPIIVIDAAGHDVGEVVGKQGRSFVVQRHAEPRITVNEVAELFGVSPDAIHAAARRGQFQGTREGGMLVFEASHIRAVYADSQTRRKRPTTKRAFVGTARRDLTADRLPQK